jgi:hypothetical protein
LPGAAQLGFDLQIIVAFFHHEHSIPGAAQHEMVRC